MAENAKHLEEDVGGIQKGNAGGIQKGKTDKPEQYVSSAGCVEYRWSTLKHRQH